MANRRFALFVACGLTTLAFVFASSIPAELIAASKAAKKPIRNPKFDPSAEKVDLFEAVEAGRISVKLIPKDAMGGNVLIENKTDKPLNVKIPDAVVGVSINAQFGGMGMGGMGGMGGGMGGMGGGMGGMGGGMQAMGGGMGGGMGGMGGGMGGMGGGMGGMGGGGMGGMGGGFFSVPAEKIVSIPFNSVCLEHGKEEPSSSSKYTLVPVARFSKDPVLYQLLVAVSSNKIDPQAAQAAAWHLSSKMSFDELAEKADPTPGALPGSSYFTKDQLFTAQRLITAAAERAAEEKTELKDDEPKAEPRLKAVKTDSVTKN